MLAAGWPAIEPVRVGLSGGVDDEERRAPRPPHGRESFDDFCRCAEQVS